MGAFLGLADTASYPIVSSASGRLLNQTSAIPDLVAKSSSNFWTALKRWPADLMFFATTATFVMGGVWYSCLEIAEFLFGKTRRSLYG